VVGPDAPVEGVPVEDAPVEGAPVVGAPVVGAPVVGAPVDCPPVGAAVVVVGGAVDVADADVEEGVAGVDVGAEVELWPDATAARTATYNNSRAAFIVFACGDLACVLKIKIN